MRKLTIVFVDAGGGHRSAADALKTVLASQSAPWDVTLLNIQEELDRLDLVRKVSGVRIQDCYNLILKKGWTRATPKLLPLLQSCIRIAHSRIVRALNQYWKQHPTDLVLSVIPHFNRALVESVHATMPGTPFVTMLTDFADYPPHFWIERESEYLIGGTEKAVKQAHELGHSRSRIFRASGMVLKPRFYQQPVVDRAAERTKLGLDPECPTGIVLFGGQGSRAMLDIAERLDATPDRLQLIMLCGHNIKLADKLRALPLKKRIFVEGFTSQVDYYMSLADFFIGKPGPGCISEALQFHLPVITECNAATMPQERYNAEWLVENRLGVALKSFREIAFGVHLLLQPEMFEEFRQNARNHSNRALFEVPEILDEVFERHAIQTVPVISFPGDLNLPRPSTDPTWAALT